MLLYIDPGLGSMVIQAIVGAVAAGSTVLFMFRQKMSKFFGHSTKEDTIEEVEKNLNKETV